MQTFLPYPSFALSADCLDYKRLGKQRVETKQILSAMNSSGGWSNHPATRMWCGYRNALLLYGLEICRSWRAMGYNDSLLPEFEQQLDDINWEIQFPHWLGDPEFHRSHQSNLLRKLPEHYGQFGWRVADNLPYIWPTGKE